MLELPVSHIVFFIAILLLIAITPPHTSFGSKAKSVNHHVTRVVPAPGQSQLHEFFQFTPYAH